MGVDKNVRSIPLVGKNIEKTIAETALALYNRDYVGKVSKDSPASVQVTPGSEFLDGIYGVNRTKIDNIEVYNIYGDVRTTIRQKIFTKTLEIKMSLGDGLVLPDSATYASWTNKSKNFAYTGNMLMNIKFDKGQGALAAEIKVDDPKTAKSLHAELLTRQDSKSKIVCLVSKENTNDCN